MSDMDHAAWTAARDAAAYGPHGLASLAATVWLDSPAADVAGEARLGAVAVRRFERDGRVAIRILDPARARRERLRGIDRFRYDPAMVIPGRVDATPVGPLPTLAVDGHCSVTTYDVTVHLEVGGAPVTLLAHRDGDQLFAAFSDATADAGEYDFRMIRVPAPERDGTVAVDLNRAYLPPSRFSPHFVCVTPPGPNRWAVAIRAGERGIVRA